MPKRGHTAVTKTLPSNALVVSLDPRKGTVCAYPKEIAARILRGMAHGEVEIALGVDFFNATILVDQATENVLDGKHMQTTDATTALGRQMSKPAGLRDVRVLDADVPFSYGVSCFLGQEEQRFTKATTTETIESPADTFAAHMVDTSTVIADEMVAVWHWSTRGRNAAVHEVDEWMPYPYAVSALLEAKFQAKEEWCDVSVFDGVHFRVTFSDGCYAIQTGHSGGERHVLRKMGTVPAPLVSCENDVAADAAAPPKEFLCPISCDLMKNPVRTADGFTYERSHITMWLALHDSSPMTNLVLDHKDLEEDEVLKARIAEWSAEVA